MKTRFTLKQLLVATLLIAASTSLRASDTPSEVITVSTAKACSGLVETWIKKYTEQHPEVQIRVVNDGKGEADLTLTQASTEADKEAEGNVAYVGRYALLPVTTTGNPLYEQINRRRFDKKELKRLFFQNDVVQEVEEGKKKDALRDGLTVYSTMGRTSGAQTFASHFGYRPSQIRGKRIAGDDIHLLTAIGKDRTGITFNTTAYLFDLQSRKLKPELSVLPLNLKKDQEQILRSGNLDETLRLLEDTEIDLIPLQTIGFVYRDKAQVRDFLQWVVSEGQQYNHASGFLTIDKKTEQKEQKRLSRLLSDR